MDKNAPDLKSGDVGSFVAQESPRAAGSTPGREDGDTPSAAGAEVSTPTPAQRPAGGRTLPAEPAWVLFDPELERLCRIAAQVGGSQAAPISYTALIVAFLWAADPVCEWFRGFVSSNTSIDRAAIFKSKAVKERDRDRYLASADSGALPAVDPLYSRSTRNLLDQAARIARNVAVAAQGPPLLGARHLMAAYAFRNPSDHVDQVRGWGIDAERWRSEYRTFVLGLGPRHGEDWARLDQAATASLPIIGSFTADDPLAPPLDLLGVEDEAAAFARIAVAGSVKPPLAIGVFGEWGSGKTFFMRLIHDKVKALSDDATRRAELRLPAGPFLPDVVQIRFNAWHYIETNLWASLVEYIFTELDRALQGQRKAGPSDAERIFNRLATAQQLKLDALDEVVSRRAERRSAELRAERARREYEEALVRASGVGAGTYARALMDSLLERPGVKASAGRVGDALGVPELGDSSGRVLEVLEQAHSEAGRARLVARAGVARLGTWPWIASVVVLLLGVPLLAVGVRDLAATLLQWPALKNIQESVLALSGALAGAAAWGGTLLNRASAALSEVDRFDKKLRALAEQDVEEAKAAPVAARKAAAEDDVRKRKQALEAAERALAEAEARLSEARSDFEAASARSRLNAFIRAKAIDGDYAKHLGIIAAIRRDFGQLAQLMGAANDDGERNESQRLAEEVLRAVERFLERLEKEPEVRMSAGEVRSLLTLLEPPAALDLLARRSELFGRLLEGAAALEPIEAELRTASQEPLPRLSRIILYIDDLDRCPPQVVVDVLQAVHLLLCFPLFTVVVAVDARWVSRALREQFPKLLGETRPFAGAGVAGESAGASSHDYLEKIFQIPYWVRPVDPDSAQRYVNTLVEPDVRRVALLDSQVESDGADPTDDAAPRPPGQPRQQDSTSSESAAPAPAPALANGAAPRSAPPLTAQAAGLELTRWEADALERFAPLIGATPRRLIRFVNLYRLLKTGLAIDARQRLVGERGESDVYRSLIVQLAIVTGAPNVAPMYFMRIAQLPPADSIGAVHDSLQADAAFKDGHDADVVLRVLASARDWSGTALTVADLRLTASTARRYSFTARGT